MPKIGGIVSGMDTDTILAQLKAIAQQPITKLKARQAELDTRTAAWDAMDAKFAGLRAASKTLTDMFSTRPTMVTSSDKTLLNANVTGTAEVGVHVVKVTQTARGQESMSNNFAAVDTPAMADGTLTLKVGNGTVDQDVTGTTLLSMLNNGAGVTLGTIRITDRTGTSAVIDLSGNITVQDIIDDISGAAGVNVTAKLNADGTGLLIQDNTGMTTGGLVVAEEGGTTAASLNILGSSLAGEVEGGDLNPLYTITVSSSNNTLEGLRDAINDFGGPFSASIVNDGTGTPYRLSVVSRYSGDASEIALTSSDPGFTFTEVEAAQDAIIKIGTTTPQEFRSRTNTFNSVIQGLSLNVLDADPAKAIIVNVESNVEGAVGTVKNFFNAYNAIVTAVAEQNTYNAETKTKGGALFNNPLLSSALSDLTNAITESVDGLTTSASSIFQIGVNAGKGGVLEVNTATLTDWMTNHYEDVKALFSSSLNGALSAVRSASSTAIDYDVNRVANGVTDPALFGPLTEGWMDNTPNIFSDWVTLQFASPRTIARAVVHTLNTNTNPVATWGIKDYDIEALRIGANPADDSSWTAVASVRNNTQGVNSQLINAFTDQLRVKVLASHAADGQSRIVEFEAFESTGASRRTGALVTRISDDVGGVFSTSRQQITEEKSRLDTQIEVTNDRVNREIARMERAFNQMESAMSKNQTMGNALTNFLNQTNANS
ncbi:MAG: flagellar filament capping protein FliD [Elusimicrobia bacterium]|nr:flagellar filament capping protein FliD [Elusimicrobiota bacterium]